MSVDLSKYKKDFPIFERKVRGGNSLVYLDSGATSQKPNSVIEAESNFYRTVNAAVHRGAHLLAEEASQAYESARANVASFIGAKDNEIVFDVKSNNNSLNHFEGKTFNGLVVADVSGSMNTNNSLPLSVSISLALYISEKNNNGWKNK